MTTTHALATARSILGGPSLPSADELLVLAQLLADEELDDVAREYIKSHLSHVVGNALVFIKTVCKLELQRVHISFSIPRVNDSLDMAVASEDTASLGLTFEVNMRGPERSEWKSTFSDQVDSPPAERGADNPEYPEFTWHT